MTGPGDTALRSLSPDSLVLGPPAVVTPRTVRWWHRFHRWTPWGATKVRPLWGFTVLYQRRECVRCGLTQERRI